MIIKLTSADEGCIVGSQWGCYAQARMIEIANSFGYEDDDRVIYVAKKIVNGGRGTDREHDLLYDADDKITEWLNENVAPEGYSFGWNDGDFMLWRDSMWEE